MPHRDRKEKSLCNVTKIPNNIGGVTGRLFLIPGIAVWKNPYKDISIDRK